MKIGLKNLPRHVATSLALSFPLDHGKAVQGIPEDPRVWDTAKDQKTRGQGSQQMSPREILWDNVSANYMYLILPCGKG